MSNQIVIINGSEPPKPSPPPAAKAPPVSLPILITSLIAIALLFIFFKNLSGSAPKVHQPQKMPVIGTQVGKTQPTGWQTNGPADPFAQVIRNARGGDPNAQVYLGEALRYGLHPMPYDPAAALQWFNRAAAHNHPVALRHMGEMILAGQGTPANYASGINFLSRAAHAGSMQAHQILHNLGYN